MSAEYSPDTVRPKNNHTVKMARLAIRRCGDVSLSPKAEEYLRTAEGDRDIVLLHFLTLRRECEGEEQKMRQLLDRKNIPETSCISFIN